jgi:hypothetical protein
MSNFTKERRKIPKIKNYCFLAGRGLVFFVAICGVVHAGTYSSSELTKVNREVDDTQFEFRGRYQVGKTYCVVKPIKMAFSVYWEKGNKKDIVFFARYPTENGKAIFYSEQKNGEDSFIFDDKTYNTGVFIRADGKQFPIRKIEKK